MTDPDDFYGQALKSFAGKPHQELCAAMLAQLTEALSDELNKPPQSREEQKQAIQKQVEKFLGKEIENLRKVGIIVQISIE